MLREGLVVIELPRLAWLLPAYMRAPRGNGEPVLVLPGFGTGDASTVGLRSFLGLLGYRARGWELGINRGNVAALLPQVIERVARAADRAGAKVRLVGWSLGGTLAREAARERPDLVERVVTLGTPAIGGPSTPPPAAPTAARVTTSTPSSARSRRASARRSAYR